MSQPCPVCKQPLAAVFHDGVRYVYCGDRLCPRNFEDLSCVTCGSRVVNVMAPEPGVYRLVCAKGHIWELPS